ncbi:hypothetical protein ILYODFUR_037681 [Ilyodon furcidens]|uniref:Uncharacterized protein n=1 Tax=Ilyodon furcidens TaxID=33524 RepID=A0ABV0SSJ9_9TELE
MCGPPLANQIWASKGPSFFAVFGPSVSVLCGPHLGQTNFAMWVTSWKACPLRAGSVVFCFERSKLDPRHLINMEMSPLTDNKTVLLDFSGSTKMSIENARGSWPFWIKVTIFSRLHTSYLSEPLQFLTYRLQHHSVCS